MNEEQNLNLIQKLAKIRTISESVVKEKQGYGYTYADITSILAKVTAGMKRYGVSLIPSIVPGTFHVEQNITMNTKLDKTGTPRETRVTEMLIYADMVFRWVNDNNPSEYIEVPWVITGLQADPSQALGSALTYCERYFLVTYFQIAISDNDVDAYRSKQKEAEAAEDKAIAEEITSNFDKDVRRYLADNPNMKEEVIALCSKYNKKGNYLAIKDPELASKLVSEFNSKFKEAK